MTNEIQKQNWKQFFDDASRDYLNWETRGEVLKDDPGAQILSKGLPLVGFAFEEKGGEEKNNIEIILGDESGAYQTHTIFNPRFVAFLPKETKRSLPAAQSRLKTRKERRRFFISSSRFRF